MIRRNKNFVGNFNRIFAAHSHNPNAGQSRRRRYCADCIVFFQIIAPQFDNKNFCGKILFLKSARSQVDMTPASGAESVGSIPAERIFIKILLENKKSVSILVRRIFY